jgi:hypothetical protein
LAALASDDFRNGAWTPIPPEPAWAGNPTWQDFISCAWHSPAGARYVVVVNYSDHRGQCRLRLPLAELAGRQFRLVDVMGSEVYDRDGSDLVAPGLFIDLGPWRYDIFRLESGEKRP